MRKKARSSLLKQIIGDKKLAEIEDENLRTARLGLYPLWELSEDHPFHLAGVDHDLAYLIAYELKRMGEIRLAREELKDADSQFCKACFRIADEKESWFLRLQANTFCYLVVSYRRLMFGVKK